MEVCVAPWRVGLDPEVTRLTPKNSACERRKTKKKLGEKNKALHHSQSSLFFSSFSLTDLKGVCAALSEILPYVHFILAIEMIFS